MSWRPWSLAVASVRALKKRKLPEPIKKWNIVRGDLVSLHSMPTIMLCLEYRQEGWARLHIKYRTWILPRQRSTYFKYRPAWYSVVRASFRYYISETQTSEPSRQLVSEPNPWWGGGGRVWEVGTRLHMSCPQATEC